MAIVNSTPSEPKKSRVTTGDAGLNKIRWFIFGPPKAGKTTTAVTVGERDGSNTILVMFDNGGANSVVADGSYTIRHLLDVQQWRIDEKLTFTQIVKVLGEEIGALIATDPTRDWKLIVDGLTQVDGWLSVECPRDSSGKPEWTVYKAMLMSLFDVVNKFQRPTVWVAHAAMDVGDVRSAEKTADAKLVTGALAGEVVKPAITGGGLNIFLNAADVIAFQVKSVTPAGKDVYTLYTDGGDKARGGNRFSKYLPLKVENANLKELEQAIKDGIAKNKVTP